MPTDEWGKLARREFAQRAIREGRAEFVSKSPPTPKRKKNRVTCLSFGRYRGVALCNVPPDYLQWVLRAMPCLPAHTRAAIRSAIDKRKSAAKKREREHDRFASVERIGSQYVPTTTEEAPF
jgi:hypothetical protein